MILVASSGVVWSDWIITSGETGSSYLSCIPGSEEINPSFALR